LQTTRRASGGSRIWTPPPWTTTATTTRHCEWNFFSTIVRCLGRYILSYHWIWIRTYENIFRGIRESIIHIFWLQGLCSQMIHWYILHIIINLTRNLYLISQPDHNIDTRVPFLTLPLAPRGEIYSLGGGMFTLSFTTIGINLYSKNWPMIVDMSLISSSVSNVGDHFCNGTQNIYYVTKITL
jgi:hypothetical protein